MSLQVKVRKDIFRYEERFYLGLTLRKALCTYPTIIVVGAILAANYWFLHIDKDLLQYIILFIALPPLAIGWIKIKDMPIENFEQLVLHIVKTEYSGRYHEEDLAKYLVLKKVSHNPRRLTNEIYNSPLFKFDSFGFFEIRGETDGA